MKHDHSNDLFDKMSSQDKTALYDAAEKAFGQMKSFHYGVLACVLGLTFLMAVILSVLSSSTALLTGFAYCVSVGIIAMYAWRRLRRNALNQYLKTFCPDGRFTTCFRCHANQISISNGSKVCPTCGKRIDFRE